MTVLKLGDRGESVKFLQQKLQILEVFSGQVDGIFGPKTEAAVKTFQKNMGLSADGIVGKETQDNFEGVMRSPNPGPTLRLGAKGDEVKSLQETLKRVGYDPGPIDGIFGPKTEAAVKAVQQKNKMVVDGIVGTWTWRKLVFLTFLF